MADVKFHQIDPIECTDQIFIKDNAHYKSMWIFSKNVTLKEHLIRKWLTEKLWQRTAEENNENAQVKG